MNPPFVDMLPAVPARRFGVGLSLLALSLPILAFALLVTVIVHDDVGVFRPSWILHPDETGMLFIGQHLAETGSPVVEDAWYLQSPAHVPDGVSLANGRLVPQKAPMGYLAYAGAFLVSDEGWRFVGPFFGLVASLCVGWLVFQKTGNQWAGLAAGLALATSSPVIMYGSGLAFVDIIALAFFLAGVVAVQRHLASGAGVSAAAAGLAFGCATLTRYDFFLAGVLALVVVLWQRRHESPLPTNLIRALPGVLPFAALIAAGAMANWWLYGSPIATGYAAGSWQSSPGGVGRSLFDFSPLDFARLGWSYLIQIGLSCTLLLALGAVVKGGLGRWDATDGLLLGFAGFGLVYFLGKEGAYGTGDAWLVSSYPRYLLPAYAAGVVLGTEAVVLLLSEIGWGRLQMSSALIAVSLIAAAIGLHEAWSNERGVPYVQRLTRVHATIRDVMEHTPYPVLVSDLSSKAVADGYTISPRRLEDPNHIVRYVERELRSRRHVLLAPQEDHPLYTGFVETLGSAGYQFIVRRQNPPVYEVVNPYLVVQPAD